MVVRETEALSSPPAAESEPLSWIPEILRERGLVTTLEEYQGNSPRLQGLQLLDKIKPDIQEKHGLDFYQPNIVILKDDLFRIYVQSGFSFPEEVKLPLIELIQKALEHSETKMLSVRRAYWTPENPNPPGPPFNALAASAEILEAITKHYQYSIEQGWHQIPETEISLNLQEFTDPSDVRIENGELVSEVIPFGGEVIPLDPKNYKVHVILGDNRAVTMRKTSSITATINGRGPRILETQIVSASDILIDREGALVPIKLPPSMYVDFLPLNDMDALRLICAAYELQEATGRTYRLEFSAGTRRGHPVIFINEVLPFERPFTPETERTLTTIKGRNLGIIRDEADVQTLKGLHPRRHEAPLVYIDRSLSSDTTRLRYVLAQLAELSHRREQSFICLHPGTETEHAFRILARELGLTGFPVLQDRRFRTGDRILIKTDGVEHSVTNLTLAGNKYGLCLQEYSEPLTDLEIGNKTESLKLLSSLSLPIPPTFVLTRDFFLSTLWKNKMLGHWGDLKDAKTPEKLEEKFKELRESLNVLPTGHWRKFLKLLHSHLASDIELIVRSSSNVEDLATRSFTGEFETVADVDFANLEDAILRVIKSPFTAKFARSIWPPRPHKGLEPDEGRRIVGGLVMPVIIMPQVQAEVSGTLFHCDTVTHNPHIITIEAQPGSGGVVSGERRAKTLNVKFDARTGKMLSLTVVEGGIVRHPQFLTTRTETLLTDDEARALFNSARLIRQRTNEYHDTEWGIGPLPGVLLENEVSDHKSQLWFFQTRPVQTRL